MDVKDSEADPVAVTNGLGGGDVSAAPAALPAEQLDLEDYSERYSGRTRLRRLLFIAYKCGVQSVEFEALRMVHDEARSREDTLLYRDAALKINGRLGPRYLYDQGWVDAVNRRVEQRKEKLENELNYYMTNLITDNIIMAHDDIGDLYYGHGHLSKAFKSYIRTQDYCTTSKHVVQMCMHVILVSIQLGQFAHVTNYVSIAEQTPDTLEPITISKLRAAAGLAYLETKKYKLAARKFIETGPELGNNYSEVIAPQDVAVYGALCALASFDRSDLKSKVIDNIKFREYLELVPEVRELVDDFYSCRYGSSFNHLEKLKPNLLLDIHLHEHLETLYKDIRHKAIIQYTLPFISVDLSLMADAFKTSVSMLEKELVALIAQNKIKARIDSHNKILYARHADQRNASFQRALQTGSEFEREVKAMLLRANLMKHDFNQRNLAYMETNVIKVELDSFKKIPYPADKKIPSAQQGESISARFRPPLEGRKGLLWLKLKSLVKEMISLVEVGLFHLYDLASRLGRLEEGIDNLADPSLPTLLRQRSLEFGIHVAQDLIRDHFAPTSLTRPFRRVGSTTVDLLEQHPDDIFKSYLQSDEMVRSMTFIQGMANDLAIIQDDVIEVGARMYQVSTGMGFEDFNFVAFRENHAQRSPHLTVAIGRATDALSRLQAMCLRFDDKELPSILGTLLCFRQFVPGNE